MAEEAGIIEEVWPSDDDIVNDLAETEDLSEPEDDGSIPTEDADSGEETDATPAESGALDTVDPDPDDIISAIEDVVLDEPEIVAEDREVTPINDNQVSLPTIGHIEQGDRVLVTVIGGEATVVGTVGSGDTIKESAENAEVLATEASDQATSVVADVQAAHSAAEGAQAAAEAAQTTAEEAISAIEEATADIERHFNFDNDGVTISATGTGLNVNITESKLAFRDNSSELAYTSGERFVAPVMQADEVHMGYWMWTERSNHNLALKWIGE